MEYSENELIYLARLGSRFALFMLYEDYYQRIRMIIYIRYRFLQKNDDYYEYIQEAYIALINAMNNYRYDKNASMQTYFILVVKNRLMTYFQRREMTYVEEKKKSISLDQEYFGIWPVNEMVADKKVTYQPDRQMQIHDQFDHYYTTLKLSPLERDILYGMYEGLDSHDLAEVLQIDIKRVYNAIYRIRQKIEKQKKRIH